MSKHFGPQHGKSGYSAMGWALARPIAPRKKVSGNVADAIAKERAQTARIAKANTKKK